MGVASHKPLMNQSCVPQILQFFINSKPNPIILKSHKIQGKKMHEITTNLTLNKANKTIVEIHNLTSLPLWFVTFSLYFNLIFIYYTMFQSDP